MTTKISIPIYSKMRRFYSVAVITSGSDRHHFCGVGHPGDPGSIPGKTFPFCPRMPLFDLYVNLTLWEEGNGLKAAWCSVSILRRVESLARLILRKESPSPITQVFLLRQDIPPGLIDECDY
jgi:hypothetical protein